MSCACAHLANRHALVGNVDVGSRPMESRIVGTIAFSHSVKYSDLESFRADAGRHRITEGGKYNWDGEGEMHAWHVSSCRRLVTPIPQPGKKGVTGFTERRRYVVSFVDSVG